MSTGTVLITGTSSGIGRSAVDLFASKGWNVTATMRNTSSEAAEEFSKLSNVLVEKLDVTNIDTIKSAVQATIDKFGALDVVINNAGYGLAGPLEFATPEQLERQYSTNVYGPVWVMQAVLPHFRKRKSGTIINVTSVGGRITLPFNSLYHGAKFALEGISEALCMELAPLGIHVKIVEPGGVKTDFAGRSLVMTSSDTVIDYNEMMQSALAEFGRRGQNGFSEPIDIAQVLYEAATDGVKKLRYAAGEDAKQIFAQRANMSDEMYIAETSKAFGLSKPAD